VPTASSPTQSPASPARGRGWARLHRRDIGAGEGNGAPGTSEGFDGGLDHSTVVIAGVTTLGLIMAVLDTTIVNVALDRLSRDLHSSLTSIEWFSTGYLLSPAALIRCQAGLLKGSAPSGPGSCRSGCSRWGRICACSRRAIGSRDGGPAHAEATTNVWET
jgi:hypothetical protein